MDQGTPTTDSATRLRALAHPLRWKLLDVVSSEGSATATRCSQVTGESVASCSYHLGILGKYGYLELVPDSPGREKPWRHTDRRQDLSAPGPELEDALAAEAATEAFLDHEWERTKARQRHKALEPAEWAKATAVGGSSMWVTADELDEIKAELLAVLYRYDARDDDVRARPEGAREARVFFSTSVRPKP
jgi:hypothetical protein